MKRREAKDLANRSNEELKKLLDEAKKALFTMQMDYRLAKLKNVRSLFWKKKEIAYILTQLRRKEQVING
ncbi:MAG TPA: 50S ribosomal protein L29 [Patescibacteria group bacterium]|nr:50S ribosomal protein L29 [Patescibacteria group bacterium]